MEEALLAKLPKSHKASNRKPEFAIKLVSLCTLTLLLPGVLLGIPLYMKYFVLQDQVYPFGLSDTRLIDKKISTIWCQSQNIKSSSPYNAFLLPGEPSYTHNLSSVTMTRRIELDDDMKEYWGFYLLKGSIITVSTCTRWPGSSLMIIQGHKHLRECAYIGDDSSEELDELEEEENKEETRDDTNKPSQMKIINSDVLKNKELGSLPDGRKISAQLLNELYNLSGTPQQKVLDKKVGTYVHLRFAEALEKLKQNQTSWRKNEKLYLEEIYEQNQKPENDMNSKEVLDNVLKMLKGLENEKRENILSRINGELGANKSDTQRIRRQAVQQSLSFGTVDDEEDSAIEQGVLHRDGHADIKGRINETTHNDQSNSEFWSSFSSSEERLMNCDGLLLNLPLTSSRECEAQQSHEKHIEASVVNAVSYKIDRNGYYFFVFSSENEIQTNFLSIHFRIDRTTYNLTNVEDMCKNMTSCSLPLRFGSNQKVVLELPAHTNDTRWNEEFLVVSTCEPRTTLYAVFIIALPILFILFAFQ